MKPYLLALMLLSGLAFSADEAPKKMLDFVQGKWVADMEATMKEPTIKAAIAKDSNMETKLKMMLGSTSYEFTKDSIIMSMKGMGDEPMVMTLPFKVLENTKKVLKIEVTPEGLDKGKPMEILFKDKDHIILPNPKLKLNAVLKRAPKK
ncbi:MAG: hypothetical protein HRT89_02890 [Lentisphaeria bacterium]|nr:hypothetical protein [Lentisphaeria bacterium]NQZ66995.1 hypothetical protein [Lentisphaeria bacterium]